MSEGHEDFGRACLDALVSEVGVRVLELAVLLSAFDTMVREAQLLEEGDVPREELFGVPDPYQLLGREADITTAEAVQILRDFLDMSAEGEARLWRFLGLVDEE
jgi:hypothetical protein